MQTAFAVFAVALAIIQTDAVSAQPVQENPADSASSATPDPKLWTMPPEGAMHAASGTRCLAQVSGFSAMQFTGAAEPNILGTCVYVDDTGTGDAGITVRRYLPGVGESWTEIENDRALIEPDPRQGAPLFMARMGPATLRDGKMGGRITITRLRNGYLVD